MKTFLEEIGINVGLSIAGLFGSLLLLGKSAVQNMKSTLISLITGVASANYLTPIVSDIAKLEDDSYRFGIGFILGFLGLKGVEKLTKLIFKENGNNESS
jgi:hypothetical protein